MSTRRPLARGFLGGWMLVLLLCGCAGLEGARLYRSGTAALDRGDTGRAIAELERAASLVPHASEVQNHLGLAYAAAGRTEAAVGAFRRAVELDCDNRAAALNLRVAETRAAQRAESPEGAQRGASPKGAQRGEAERSR